MSMQTAITGSLYPLDPLTPEKRDAVAERWVKLTGSEDSLQFYFDVEEISIFYYGKLDVDDFENFLYEISDLIRLCDAEIEVAEDGGEQWLYQWSENGCWLCGAGYTAYEPGTEVPRPAAAGDDEKGE